MSKLMSALANVLLFAGYVLVEYFAYLSFLHAPAGIDPLLTGFVVQALVAIVQALLLRQMLPSRYREPRLWTLLLLWVLCTFVPLGAGFVLLASCIWAAWWPGTRDSDQLADVPRPEFVTYLVSRVSHGGGARLQARLINTQVNASDRLSALVAIQSMPTRTTGTLLRELLADPVEDVRLIAYGTLDQAENDVMQKIFQTAQTLEAAQNDSERRAIN